MLPFRCMALYRDHHRLMRQFGAVPLMSITCLARRDRASDREDPRGAEQPIPRLRQKATLRVERSTSASTEFLTPDLKPPWQSPARATEGGQTASVCRSCVGPTQPPKSPKRLGRSTACPTLRPPPPSMVRDIRDRTPRGCNGSGRNTTRQEPGDNEWTAAACLWHDQYADYGSCQQSERHNTRPAADRGSCDGASSLRGGKHGRERPVRCRGKERIGTRINDEQVLSMERDPHRIDEGIAADPFLRFAVG